MNNDIQSIFTGTTTSNINVSNMLNNSVSTESMDLEAIAQKAYNDELAKHQAEISAANIRYEEARKALEQVQESAAELSSGNVQTIAKYDANQLLNLRQQALDNLISQNTLSFPTAEEVSAEANKIPQTGWENNIPIGGMPIAIPSSIPQTGIIKNYTNYDYFYGKWTKGSAQRALSEQWNASGRTSDRGIATLNNRYLVAVSPKFGTVGDNIDICLDNGSVIQATIADAKGGDAKSEWGHTFGKAVDVIEWESMGGQSIINTDGWQGHKVSQIINRNRA